MDQDPSLTITSGCFDASWHTKVINPAKIASTKKVHMNTLQGLQYEYLL